MKKKMVGIFVCMLLIFATILPVTGNVNINNNPERIIEDSIYNIMPFEFFNKKLGVLNDRASNDMFIDIKQTSDGGYIATGTTYTFGDFFYDVWLVKFNSSGGLEWHTAFDQIVGNDFGFSVEETSDGGYIIAGCYAATGTYLSLWLIKTDSNGILGWDSEFGTKSAHDIAYCVKQTSDGGYAVIGFTQSFGTGSNDAWLIKTDADGNELWNKTYGGSNSDNGFCIQEINDGFIITGETESYGNGNDDAWVIKTDLNGTELWNTTYGGISKDSGHCIMKTTNGYSVLGSVSSYGDLDDFWLIEIDSNGGQTSEQTWTGANTGVSGFSVFGKYRGGISMKNTNDGGKILTGITDVNGTGARGAYLIKINSTGSEEWIKIFGGEFVDEIYSVDQASDGGFILGGTTRSYGTDAYDGWAIKTDSNGYEEWNVTIPFNEPPYDPSDPDPENGETDVEIDIELNWTCGDPNEDPLTYDIYFGTESPPPKVKSNHSDTTYNPGILDFETKYFWQIVAWDTRNLSTSGPIWNFTTRGNDPPNTPSDPNPYEGETDVSIYTCINWTSDDPDGDDVTYDVYLGKNSEDLELVSSNQTYKIYCPDDNLEFNTTYNWKIVAWDEYSYATEGPIWNFSTEEDLLPEGRIESEGFEEDIMPPSGWEHVPNSNNTWDIEEDDFYTHSGSFGAVCHGGPVGEPQNERLISSVLNFSSMKNIVLSFWWKSDYDKMVVEDNFDVFVEISVDKGSSWDTVWTSGDIGVFTSWEWYNTSLGVPISLDDYENESNVLISWRFYGEDTADFILDEILIVGIKKVPVLNLVDIKGGIGRITGDLENSGDVIADSISWKTDVVLPDGLLKKLLGGLLFVPKQKEWVSTDTDFRLNMLGLGRATVNISYKYTVLNSSGHNVDLEGYRQINLLGFFVFLKTVQQPVRPWVRIDPQDIEYVESQDPPYDKFVKIHYGVLNCHNVRVIDSDSSDVLLQGSCCFDGEVGVLYESFISRGIVETGNAFWEVELKEGD